MVEGMDNYNKITQLSAIEQIRRRPGMWIGSTENPKHLFNEVFDNSIDECLAGYCTEIEITIDKNKCKLKDNGRGIPHNKTDKGIYSIIAVTEAFSGGKFDKEAYSHAVGLHGVGLCAVRALSKFMSMRSVRDKKEQGATFKDGEYQNDWFEKDCTNKSRGTVTEFEVDGSFFDTDIIPLDHVIDRCRMALLEIPKLKIWINKERVEPYSPTAILGECDIMLNRAEGDDGTDSVYALVGYTSQGDTQSTKGSVNFLPVNEGSHINLMNKALIKAWQDSNLLYNSGLQPEDVLIGSHVFISAKLSYPSFTSQDKKVLNIKYNEYAQLIDPLAKSLTKAIKALNNDYKAALIKKFKDYREAKNKLSTAKYLNGVIKFGESESGTIRRGTMDGESKLNDCMSSDRETTELYIVEGDSAGGSILATRDPNIHAVLPLRGKPKNIMNDNLESILKNVEMRSLINALGTGLMEHEKPELIRYGKIIVAADSDVDGMQISSLVIAALCYLVPKTVLSGRVYLAEAPLYGQVRGKEFVPIWKEEDIDPKYHTKYFKGLGSLNPDQAYPSLLDPNKRRLYQITGENIQQVMDLVSSTELKKQLMLNLGVIGAYC